MANAIKVTNEKDTGITMVWYKGKNGVQAVNVTNSARTRWACVMGSKTAYGISTKTEAVNIAKMWLKATM